MRQFTDAEKQILQAKIKDEQERREQGVKEISRRIEEEASKNRAVNQTLNSLCFLNRRTMHVMGSFWKYGFLGVTFCLLVFNVTMVLIWRNVASEQVAKVMYANLVVALMLLFNHVAFHITKRGWASRVMKTVAVIWIVIASTYLIWMF